MAEPPKKTVHRLVKPQGVPLRDSMAHFVATVRLLDSWWKEQEAAKPPTVHDVNSPFVKSSASRSTDPDELLQFVAESELQINFLMRMPSIERCLREWWTYASQGEPNVTAAKLASLYQSLATVFIRAKKPNLQKSAVRTLMRRQWVQWGPKVPPLSAHEFGRLVFLLAHMVVESEKLPDYVACLTTTLRQVQGLRAAAEDAQEKILQRRKTRSLRNEKKDSALPRLGDERHSSVASAFSVAVAVAGHGLRRREGSIVDVGLSFEEQRHRSVDSSQVVVTDLSLLAPAFQPKFLRSEPLLRSPYMAPLHIQSMRSMNQRSESAPAGLAPAETAAATMPVQSLDDIERLVAQCQAALPSVDKANAQMLRRNFARPPVLDRLS
ncbi:hypothetical protein ACHHYP_02060 [Achlya hypogyna]|uniref:Uncharacterized protein n=1 Tax=Achlya hypogyna TaxID=1202772 RepID=A0A1V9ZSE3_ACHHY|nr:hypothetical protein ACHHYP_02060 [Achlya hypogyna]